MKSINLENSLDQLLVKILVVVYAFNKLSGVSEYLTPKVTNRFALTVVIFQF
jgi:hypothetical protein